MQATVQRRSILVSPEGPQDLAFIEDTLGLKATGDYVLLRRISMPVNGATATVIVLETVMLPVNSDADPDAPVVPDDGEPKTVEELVNPKKSDDEDPPSSGTPPVGTVH